MEKSKNSSRLVSLGAIAAVVFITKVGLYVWELSVARDVQNSRAEQVENNAEIRKKYEIILEKMRKNPEKYAAEILKIANGDDDAIPLNSGK